MSGLLRGMARTAMVAGTATAVSNRVSRRQAGRWATEEQAAPAYPPQQQYAGPPPVVAPPGPPPQAAAPPTAVPPTAAPPTGTMDVKLSVLRELGELWEQGILTDAEFAAQKARVLGS